MKFSEVAAVRLAHSAFLIRLVATIMMHFLLPLGFMAPDEITYDARGAALASYWHGDVPIEPALRGESKGFYYVVGWLYFPFGQFPLLPKLLGAWIGSRAVLELYRMTRLIGGSETAALRGARFMTYFPSQILWSSLLVRDVWVQWLLLRLAREMAELKGRFIPSNIVSAAVLIWALTQFRSYLLFVAVGPFAVSFLLGKSRDIVRNLFLGSVVTLALVYFGAQAGGSEAKVQTLDLVELQRLRSWSSNAAVADSAFGSDADVSTVGGALALLPTGLLYFFFAPFPWQIGSIRQSLAVPESIYFYTLFPGIVSGIAYLARKHLIESVGVLLVTMTVTFGYAIGQGNVGTLYRHKAQVMGFYYAFAAIGLEARRRNRGVAPTYPAYQARPGAPASTPSAAYSSGPAAS
jgi:hypothetical protein